MGQAAAMGLDAPPLVEVVEGASPVLGSCVGVRRDHAPDQVVGDAGQYVSALYFFFAVVPREVVLRERLRLLERSSGCC